jgi:hypothetical protein
MASNGSSVQNFFSGLLQSVEPQAESYVVSYFANTPTGAKIESKIASGYITSLLQNPLVLVGILVVIYLIFRKSIKA